MASNTSSINQGTVLSQLKTHLPQMVSDIVDHYLHLQLGPHFLPCPYWRNKDGIRGPLDGKGRPEEIELESARIAQGRDMDFHTSTPEEIIAFLYRNKIGVDCSGLAYQILDSFNQSGLGRSLDTYITPTPGGNPFNQKRFRTNADYLTNASNSRPVSSIAEIQAGDLIRLDGGRHVTVILELQENTLTYIHSTREYTQMSGVHFGQIKITDTSKSLELQDWQEITNDDQTLGKQYFHPSQGDGVFRLKWW